MTYKIVTKVYLHLDDRVMITKWGSEWPYGTALSEIHHEVGSNLAEYARKYALPAKRLDAVTSIDIFTDCFHNEKTA